MVYSFNHFDKSIVTTQLISGSSNISLTKSFLFLFQSRTPAILTPYKLVYRISDELNFKMVLVEIFSFNYDYIA